VRFRHAGVRAAIGAFEHMRDRPTTKPPAALGFGSQMPHDVHAGLGEHAAGQRLGLQT